MTDKIKKFKNAMEEFVASDKDTMDYMNLFFVFFHAQKRENRKNELFNLLQNYQ